MIGMRSVLAGVAVVVWLIPAATLAQSTVGAPFNPLREPPPMPNPAIPAMPTMPTIPGISTPGPTIQLPPVPNLSVPQAQVPPGVSGPTSTNQRLRKCPCYVWDPTNNSRSKVGCEPRCCTDSANEESCASN